MGILDERWTLVLYLLHPTHVCAHTEILSLTHICPYVNLKQILHSDFFSLFIVLCVRAFEL